MGQNMGAFGPEGLRGHKGHHVTTSPSSISYGTLPILHFHTLNPPPRPSFICLMFYGHSFSKDTSGTGNSVPRLLENTRFTLSQVASHASKWCSSLTPLSSSPYSFHHHLQYFSVLQEKPTLMRLKAQWALFYRFSSLVTGRTYCPQPAPHHTLSLGFPNATNSSILPFTRLLLQFSEGMQEWSPLT